MSTLRAPGISFTVVPPATPQTLPRMDIAGFVGFASSGPIDTPVPIEDPAAFSALFGPDLYIARDEEAGTDVYGNLGPAVRAFFSAGGTRCWIVRVADAPRTAAVPVPGLVSRTAEGELVPASVAARSAGAWANGLAVSAALTSEPLDVAWAAIGSGLGAITVGETPRLATGDLVRLTIGARTAMMVLDAGRPSESWPPMSPPAPGDGTTTRTVALTPGSIVFARAAVEGASGLPPDKSTGEASLPWDSAGPVTATFLGISGGVVSLSLEAGLSPRAGEYLIVKGLLGQAGEDLWLAIDDVQVDSGDPHALRVSGSGEFIPRPADAGAWFEGRPDYAERLTVDLFAQPAGGPIMQRPGLGLAMGHPDWIGLLPSDEQLFGPVAPRAASAQPDPMWGEIETLWLWTELDTPSLWSEVATPRLPVAAAIGRGLPLVGPFSYPLCMPVIPSHWSTPVAAGEQELTRNGLERFDSTLFIDDKLRGEETTQLLEDADRITFTGSAPVRLHGLHALLYNDEVTLICAPDAVHRGWTLAPAPAPSKLRGFARFLQPGAEGAFQDCDARPLAAPVLRPPVPGLVIDTSPPTPVEGDVFTLMWTAVDVPDATYVLEQSIDPAFPHPTTYYEGSATSLVVYSLAAGQQSGAGPYFRVRAFAGKRQSDWSNAVQIVTGPRLRPVLIPLSDYSPATLIDVHRALLRAAAARGDVLAVLALPSHYAEGQTLGHLGQLQTAREPAPDGGPLDDWPLDDVPPISPAEALTLSFGALYHPWPVLVENNGAAVAVPPDGPLVGLIAAQAQSGLTWDAPGNVPVTGAVALTPALDPRVLAPGATANLNVLSQTPIGFVSMSAWTLFSEPDLNEITVRRLLSLLRRMAVLLGPRYVFEPNDETLVHTVRSDFEAMLSTLYTAGAFAGATPAESYFLNVLTGSDPRSGLDVAQLIVEIGVAPSMPLRFLTVRLTQEAGGATQVGGS